MSDNLEALTLFSGTHDCCPNFLPNQECALQTRPLLSDAAMVY